MPDNECFTANVTATYNVIEAACKLGVKKIIIASSETTYGVCFSEGDTEYHSFPLEEDYARVVCGECAMVARDARTAAHRSRLGSMRRSHGVRRVPRNLGTRALPFRTTRRNNGDMHSPPHIRPAYPLRVPMSPACAVAYGGAAPASARQRVRPAIWLWVSTIVSSTATRACGATGFPRRRTVVPRLRTSGRTEQKFRRSVKRHFHKQIMQIHNSGPPILSTCRPSNAKRRTASPLEAFSTYGELVQCFRDLSRPARVI